VSILAAEPNVEIEDVAMLANREKSGDTCTLELTKVNSLQTRCAGTDIMPT